MCHKDVTNHKPEFLFQGKEPHVSAVLFGVSDSETDPGLGQHLYYDGETSVYSYSVLS